MARHRSDRNLLLVFGQEGAGKSTVLRSLLRKTPSAAQVDAEDLGQVHPWVMDAEFLDLLWNNVIDVIHNFWRAGYENVLAGSHLVGYEDYSRFRQRLEGEVNIFIVQLCASKGVRDRRRIGRSKPSNRAARDWVDKHYPEDQELQDHLDEYQYVRIDSSGLSVAQTVSLITRAFPGIYGQ
jgi:hypothetical protein